MGAKNPLMENLSKSLSPKSIINKVPLHETYLKMLFKSQKALKGKQKVKSSQHAQTLENSVLMFNVLTEDGLRSQIIYNCSST